MEINNRRDLQKCAIDSSEARAKEGANKFLILDHHVHPERIPEGHHEPSTRRCSLYVLLTIFTPPDSQDFALLGSWL